MTNLKLWKQWRLTRRHLNDALGMLPSDLVENDGSDREQEIGTVRFYEEYIQHNELELALDQLEALGRLNDVRGGFWRHLSKAAALMQLNDRCREYTIEFNAALSKRAAEWHSRSRNSEAGPDSIT